MNRTLLTLALFALTSAPEAYSAALYNNTANDTFNTLLFSVGPYSGIGDQIHLAAAGNAETSLLQLYNAGGAGTFDVMLRFYEVGGPAGVQIGPAFITPMGSAGSDVIDVVTSLGGLTLPQDLIFLVSLTSVSPGMDLGLNMFEPPTVGSSDNTFLIVDSGGFAAAVSAGENVYFQLNGQTAVPEPSTVSLLGAALVAAGLWLRWRIGFSNSRRALRTITSLPARIVLSFALALVSFRGLPVGDGDRE